MGKTFIGMATIDDSLNFENGKLSLDYGTGLQIDSNKKVSIKKNTDSNNALIADENGLYCDNVPIGGCIAFAGDHYTAPSGRGWLFCNGANVSRTTYATLFAVIGITFGAGDGVTTFALPNGNARYIAGTTGDQQYVNGYGLPNITGAVSGDSLIRDCNYKTSGAIRYGSGLGKYGFYTGYNYNISQGLAFNASWSNSIYGVTTNSIKIPAWFTRWYIKAFY